MGGYLTRESRARQSRRTRGRTGSVRPTRGINLANAGFDPIGTLLEHAGRPPKPFQARPRRRGVA